MKALPGVWITKIWWVHGLRGLCAILFGAYALFAPGRALNFLILLFGIYALVDGVFALWTALHGTGNKELLRTSLVEGVTGIVIGAAVLVAPHLTELALVYFIAVWAGLTGLLQIFVVDKQNRVTLNEGSFVIVGILSLLVAGLLLLFPRVGILLLMWALGGYLLVFGLLILNLAWRLYQHEHRKPFPPSHLPLANQGK